jgi:1,3-beta-glucanosyltransferase GAS1
MMSSLQCVVKSSVSTDDYKDTFDYACGLNQGAYCAGIAANATIPSYGAYGMCNDTEKLSFVMNNVAKGSNNFAQGCDFGGKAMSKAAASPTGNCKALMSEAGTAGTGTVTSAPTATGAGSKSSSTSKAAAANIFVPTFDFGMLRLSMYVVGAIFSGAAMILL